MIIAIYLCGSIGAMLLGFGVGYNLSGSTGIGVVGALVAFLAFTAVMEIIHAAIYLREKFTLRNILIFLVMGVLFSMIFMLFYHPVIALIIGFSEGSLLRFSQSFNIQKTKQVSET